MKFLSESLNYLKLMVNDEQEAASYLETFTEQQQAGILVVSKILLAKVNMSSGVDMSGKCYGCKHRRNVPGDCHSSCANPVALAIGDSYGIEKGWFFHPFNFDPVWLKYCDGYEKEK